jgi:hypothetical protein
MHASDRESRKLSALATAVTKATNRVQREVAETLRDSYHTKLTYAHRAQFYVSLLSLWSNACSQTARQFLGEFELFMEGCGMSRRGRGALGGAGIGLPLRTYDLFKKEQLAAAKARARSVGCCLMYRIYSCT